MIRTPCRPDACRYPLRLENGRVIHTCDERFGQPIEPAERHLKAVS